MSDLLRDGNPVIISIFSLAIAALSLFSSILMQFFSMKSASRNVKSDIIYRESVRTSAELNELMASYITCVWQLRYSVINREAVLADFYNTETSVNALGHKLRIFKKTHGDRLTLSEHDFMRLRQCGHDEFDDVADRLLHAAAAFSQQNMKDVPRRV